VKIFYKKSLCIFMNSPPGWGLDVGLTILAYKKIVEKPPRNSAAFCAGGQGLSWAVEPRKEERRKVYVRTSRDNGTWA
jgi:hypothetical protein